MFSLDVRLEGRNLGQSDSNVSIILIEFQFVNVKGQNIELLCRKMIDLSYWVTIKYVSNDPN